MICINLLSTRLTKYIKVAGAIKGAVLRASLEDIL